MKIAVLGAGGVGGYFGGKLAAHGEDVWFIARGSHLAAMQSKGLVVQASDEEFVVPPSRVAGSPAGVGPVDVVLFCVKSYDTEQAALQLAPLLTGKSLIVSLQNGIDNEEKIARAVPTGMVLGGVAYIFATVAEPGRVVETGGPRKIIFGPLAPPAPPVDEKCRALLRVLMGAGINAEYAVDMSTPLWKKYILISALGGLTALTRLTLGEILAVDETRSLFLDALRETDAVAQATGLNIERGFAEHTVANLRKYENNTRSSLYYDLTHGRPMEIEALSGTVVRLGIRHGVQTPIHRMIYSALLPYHLRHTHNPPTARTPAE